MKKLSEKTQTPPDIHTVFEFSLPFAIPVPNGIYEIYKNKKRIDLLIKRIQANTGFGTSNDYIQIQNDTKGYSSHSYVCMNFSWNINLDEEGRIPTAIISNNIPIPPRSKEKELVIETINNFIEVVRFTTENYWISRLKYPDISLFSCYHWDGKKRFDGYTAFLDTGIGGLKVGNGEAFALTDEKMNKLKSFLIEEKPLDSANMLLLYAKKACLEENYRLAIIEAVAGLEVALADFIQFKGSKTTLKKGELNGFIKTFGLYMNLKVTLKLLSQGLEQVDDEVLKCCQSVIEKRNDIMHKGLLEVEAAETEKGVLAIQSMVNYLRKMIMSKAD